MFLLPSCSDKNMNTTLSSKIFLPISTSLPGFASHKTKFHSHLCGNFESYFETVLVLSAVNNAVFSGFNTWRISFTIFFSGSAKYPHDIHTILVYNSTQIKPGTTGSQIVFSDSFNCTLTSWKSIPTYRFDRTRMTSYTSNPCLSVRITVIYAQNR